MKIRYRIEDGIITEVETHPTHILVEKDGEIIEEYNGEMIPYAGHRRVAENLIEEIQGEYSST